MSDRTWAWCLAELRDKASTYRETGRVDVLDAGSRVCKADLGGSVGQEICEALAGAGTELMADVVSSVRGGNGEEAQVVDILDLSLCPLVFGKTKVLVEGGTVPLDCFLSLFGKGRTETRFPKTAVSSQTPATLPFQTCQHEIPMASM
jgi:uncharacterized protein DUF4246